MIGLHGPAGNQRVGALVYGLGHQKLQFARFVAPAGQAQQIVSFHINGGAGKFFRKSRKFFNRGSAFRITATGKFGQVHYCVLLI